MRKNEFKLISGLEMNRKHPVSFEIPSLLEKEQISVGDSVKLMFEFKKGVERMWVLVTKIEDGCLTGILDNMSVFKNTIAYGDTVQFTKDHVISIMGKRRTSK